MRRPLPRFAALREPLHRDEDRRLRVTRWQRAGDVLGLAVILGLTWAALVLTP